MHNEHLVNSKRDLNPFQHAQADIYLLNDKIMQISTQTASHLTINDDAKCNNMKIILDV